MRPIKPMKIQEKKKRLMDFKNGIISDWRNGLPPQNSALFNRSCSGGKNKRVILINDYEDSGQKNSQEKNNKKNNTMKRRPEVDCNNNKKSTP